MGVGGITRIALDVEASALADRLIVAYSGVSRQSGINNWQVMKRRIDGEPSLIDHFEQICLVARTMRTALVAGDWREVGHQMNREWELRKCLAPGVTTPAIDNLIKKARGVGALGAKVCGAGGGGCIVSLAEPTDVVAVSSALSSCGATILPCDVDTNGLQITLGVAPPE
jgi:D-glycero-alpha-D-manno-heptose-7-phosphate kinase